MKTRFMCVRLWLQGQGWAVHGERPGSALDAVGIYSQGAGRRGWGQSVDGKELAGGIRGRESLARSTYQGSQWRQARCSHLTWERTEDEDPEQRQGARGRGHGGGGLFLLELHFMRKSKDGPRRSFRSLAKVWSSKDSLSRAFQEEGIAEPQRAGLAVAGN